MMEIPAELIDSMLKDTISIGDVYLLKMDESNDVTPKSGDDYRYKFYIVLGFDSLGNVYGGVIVNSSVNQRLSQSIKDFHIPISCSKYSFLKKDSFVNCANLKPYPLSNFIHSYKLGIIQQDDLDMIIKTVVASPNEKKVNLKRFGLIK